MLAKRIIPCLDIKDGRTVKGVNFLGLRDAGNPVELASKYANEGADELVFLDITATHEKRKTLLNLVTEVAKEIKIPFTVGGGISEIDDVKKLLYAGADKISINSAAVNNPKIIENLSKEFGSQCIVIAVDAKYVNNEWIVFIRGGRTATEKKLFTWIKEAEELGAGEILFTSMDNDGVKSGFAIEALKQIHEISNIPLIASGGAGSMEHFVDVFKNGKADAALAASIFHFKEIEIPTLKEFLREHNIPMRL